MILVLLGVEHPTNFLLTIFDVIPSKVSQITPISLTSQHTSLTSRSHHRSDQKSSDHVVVQWPLSAPRPHQPHYVFIKADWLSSGITGATITNWLCYCYYHSSSTHCPHTTYWCWCSTVPAQPLRCWFSGPDFIWWLKIGQNVRFIAKRGWWCAVLIICLLQQKLSMSAAVGGVFFNLRVNSRLKPEDINQTIKFHITINWPTNPK